MAKTTFKPGDEVAIFNVSMADRFFVEGKATIIRKLDYADEHYLVRFANGDEVPRFVDYRGQADPEAFAQELNDAMAAKL